MNPFIFYLSLHYIVEIFLSDIDKKCYICNYNY